MVYDCIMFNDELDILELRLAYMYDRVDKFVIAESSLTHSNVSKPLCFKNNSDRFIKYKEKIVYVEVPPLPQKDSWAGEFYQRNYLKTALQDCTDDDLIVIADIDELVDLDQLTQQDLTHPCMLEMPMYYYFFNLKTSIKWCRTLVSPYKYLKDFNIGDRLKYPNLNPVILKSEKVAYGWHFSYLFGWNIDLYVSKLKSFSHQELNTPYYLDERRINTCLKLGIDFLERYSIYDVVDMKTEFPDKLLQAMKIALPLDKYVYQKPPLSFYLNPYHLKYYLKFVVKLNIRKGINRLLPKKHAYQAN